MLSRIGVGDGCDAGDGDEGGVVVVMMMFLAKFVEPASS